MLVNKVSYKNWIVDFYQSAHKYTYFLVFTQEKFVKITLNILNFNISPPKLQFKHSKASPEIPNSFSKIP